VQREYDAGSRAPELAEKYGVHVSSIYLLLKKDKESAGGATKSARAKDASKRGGFNKDGSPAANGSAAANSPTSVSSGAGGVISATLANLRAQRSEIDRAIAALEGIRQ
jgi:hypothetical protein